MFLYFQDVVIINGNGIFINPLHIKIQYSAVLSPPPALISHCDQEKYTLTYYIEFYNNICIGNTMIFRVQKRPRNYLPRSNPLFFSIIIISPNFLFFSAPFSQLFPDFCFYFVLLLFLSLFKTIFACFLVLFPFKLFFLSFHIYVNFRKDVK